MVLGSSAGRPTRERHLAGAVVEAGATTVLVDCGEGTQFQLLRAGVSAAGLAAICITHLHGDHVLGLPGLLGSLSLGGRTRPLTIIGPVGLRHLVDATRDATASYHGFDLHFVEHDPDAALTAMEPIGPLHLTAAWLRHRVPCLGYRFDHPPLRPRVDRERAAALGLSGPDIGRVLNGEAVSTDAGEITAAMICGPERPTPSVCIFGDTEPCDTSSALARHCSLMVHEATFAEAETELARAYGHSTARQTAEVARAADTGALLLTHFSTRYPDASVLVGEASDVFSPVAAAEELRWYEVPTEPTGAADTPQPGGTIAP